MTGGILLTAAYDGTAYSGFQLQKNGDTVAARLNAALSKLYGAPVSVRGASRTDAGVHALGQRAFYATAGLPGIPPDKLPRAVNTFLPEDISVFEAERVGRGFHVVTSAKRKTYRYQIRVGPVNDPLTRLYCAHVPIPLNTRSMADAAKAFIGERDFAACMASGGAVKTTVRTVYALELSESCGLITLTVTGNGFLYNMVRIIAGTLIETGLGRIPADSVHHRLESRNRTSMGRTAPPRGLTLMSIEY